VSYISNQIMDMSDLGEALITQGLAAKEMSLKRSICFMNSTTSSLVILLPSDRR